jgi:hypothetical protein
MNATTGPKFCIVLLCAALLCTDCRWGKPVEIMLPAPDAQFAGGQEILFTAITHNFEGSRITVRWNFGDGTAAEGCTARHAYDRKGGYTATVTVTNEFSSTASDNVSLEITSSRFVKLSPDGAALPDNVSLWVMVYDVTTKLVWEMKNSRDFVPDYDNPHDGDNTYTWYDEKTLSNGGDSGTPGAGNDTTDFIDLLNMQQLGGFTDWRMPDCGELASIQDGDRFNPAVNTDYFPDTAAWYYWSATSYVDPFAYAACHIDFFGTKPTAEALRRVGVFNHYGYKSFAYHARAVRSAD